MEYSEKNLTAIVLANRQVLNEIEARDVVFRFKLGKRLAPWIMMGRGVLQQEEFDLWVRLQAKELSNHEAIELMTDLMEQYYGKKYPLRRVGRD